MIRSLAAAFFLTAVSISAAFAQTEVVPTPTPTPEPVVVPRVHPPQGLSKEVPLIPPADKYVRPDANRRFKRYLNSMVGPVSLGRNLFNSGVGTWRNSPEEWGGQWEGFGRRVASNLGRNVIRQTTIYGLDEALKLDSGYYRAKGKSTGAKIKNALISPVTARTRSGKRTIGIPRLVGTYTSSIVAYETWYPARCDYKDGLKSGTISFGFNAAFNLFKEFIWKK